MKRTILLLATLLLACGAINAQNLVFHDVRDLVEDKTGDRLPLIFGIHEIDRWKDKWEVDVYKLDGSEIGTFKFDPGVSHEVSYYPRKDPRKKLL